MNRRGIIDCDRTEPITYLCDLNHIVFILLIKDQTYFPIILTIEGTIRSIYKKQTLPICFLSFIMNLQDTSNAQFIK